ncbi:P-loop NTPase fold protein [Nocardioides sp. NPDC087217]|uniref:KAP family P-loop NTPase fold protein n=1 Tax=Nocardioides sp. NPDC087217 TaxID=3364335 RepID=UPI003818D1B3
MSQTLFGDDELADESEDVLDRAGYARHVVDVIQTIRGHGAKSSVLAVVGPWGSGKSSVVSMAKNMLKKSNDQWIIAEFTPWIYPDADTMQVAFFRELRSVLPKDRKWKRKRETIGSLGEAISPIGKVGGVVGVDASGAISSLSKVVAGDTSTNATKIKAESALSQLDHPVLMILDDLDRLSPGELLMTFKLVRFVGRLPNVYYLLCYDERTLLDVLMKTDLVGDESRRAQDYLEKMVQVRLDLPPLRENQSLKLVNEALAVVLNGNNLVLDEEEANRLGVTYSDALHERLDTPRAIRRFFAQVDAFYPTLGQEVDFVDFLCLTWLRTFEPHAYRYVYRNKAALTSSSVTSSDLKGTAAIAYWAEQLEESKVPAGRSQVVIEVLKALFACVRSSINQVEEHGADQELHEKRRVAHVDYFDRYFAFSVPSEDVRDSTVRCAFDPGDPSFSDSHAQVAEQFPSDTARISRKIRALLRKGLADPQLVLLFACSQLSHVQPGGGLLDNSRRSLEFMTRDAILQLTPEEGPGVLDKLAIDPETTSLLAWEIARLTRPGATSGDHSGVSFASWSDAAVETAAASIKKRFHEGDWGSADDVPDNVMKLIWPWLHLAETECQHFIRSQVSSWGMLATLMRMVPESTLYGGTEVVQKLNEFPIDEVQRFVDVNEALAVLADEIASLADGSNVAGQWTIEPTPENRRALVLETLRDEARRRAEEA